MPLNDTEIIVRVADDKHSEGEGALSEHLYLRARRMRESLFVNSFASAPRRSGNYLLINGVEVDDRQILFLAAITVQYCSSKPPKMRPPFKAVDAQQSDYGNGGATRRVIPGKQDY